VPFLTQGLALPVSPFFRGLLDFYSLNLMHLNPNFVLQVAVFVHLCKAFLGILPHFGLWKYLYHCRSGMAGGQHQLVGGADLELHQGRKTEYLDIPLKDSIKGWRFEWFTTENHNKSLHARSGRQSDVRTPSWTEVPTDSKFAKSKILLVEIYALKNSGLTVEAVVVDFIFKNIQPLKDRVCPAYLYTGVNDPSRIIDKQISEEDVLSLVDSLLRGKASNAGAPTSYSAWNLPPVVSVVAYEFFYLSYVVSLLCRFVVAEVFSEFISNPPVQDNSPDHIARPSLEEIEAFITAYRGLPEEEKQTHLEMQAIADKAEANVVHSMLADESSESVRNESASVAAGRAFGGEERVCSPDGVHHKRTHRAGYLAVSPETKRTHREGSELSSSSAASMDVHVVSSLVQSEEVVVMSHDLPTALAGSATSEVSNPGVEDLLRVVGAEIPLGVTLSISFNPSLVLKPAIDIASTSVPPFDGNSTPLALGFPLFLSTLQVS
jgi:hypothetical protein